MFDSGASGVWQRCFTGVRSIPSKLRDRAPDFVMVGREPQKGTAIEVRFRVVAEVATSRYDDAFSNARSEHRKE